MAFDSFTAFVAMGGHGPYVWTCYAVFFALSIVLIGWSKKQRRDALRSQARDQSRAAPATSAGVASFERVQSSKSDG